MATTYLVIIGTGTQRQDVIDLALDMLGRAMWVVAVCHVGRRSGSQLRCLLTAGSTQVKTNVLRMRRARSGG